MVKWIRKRKNKISRGLTQIVLGYLTVSYHRLEVGHLRGDSSVAVAVGPQNELSIQTHNSIETG